MPVGRKAAQRPRSEAQPSEVGRKANVGLAAGQIPAKAKAASLLALQAALLALVAGCADPVRTESYVRPSEGPLAIGRVAIAPFRVEGALARERESTRGPTAGEAAQLVERFIAEALAARGVEVVPAADVRLALRLSDPALAPPPPRVIAQVVHREFGVPALVQGRVFRFRGRSGEAMATAVPASVAFEVVLYSAPGGARLWRAVFDETQKPLNENVFQTSRYPGRGTRWLRAEELARWGAKQVARTFPASP